MDDDRLIDGSSSLTNAQYRQRLQEIPDFHLGTLLESFNETGLEWCLQDPCEEYREVFRILRNESHFQLPIGSQFLMSPCEISGIIEAANLASVPSVIGSCYARNNELNLYVWPRPAGVASSFFGLNRTHLHLIIHCPDLRQRTVVVSAIRHDSSYQNLPLRLMTSLTRTRNF